MWLFILVFAAGVVVGLGELLSRHRDYPLEAIASAPSAFYLILNGLLSILALLVVRLAPPDWLMTTDTTPVLDLLKTVLLVGFGAAAFFRSSFFKLRTNDGELSVGPGLIIEVFLKVIDEAVDRRLGETRLDDVTKIMQGVSFVKAKTELPTLCFGALRRLADGDQQAMALEVRRLTDATDMTDQSKAVSLGLALMTVTGKPILSKAVKELGSTITATPPPAPVLNPVQPGQPLPPI